MDIDCERWRNAKRAAEIDGVFEARPT